MKRDALQSPLLCATILGLLLGSFTAAAEGAASSKPQRVIAAPLAARAAAATYAYDDVPATAIIIDNQTACGGREIVRTFNVADSFTVVNAKLGFNADHSFRGDLRVALQSPAGTRVELINANTRDSWANLDLMLSDASTNPINDLSNDNTLAPYYEREAHPRNPFSAFSGQNAAGAWTLTVCDAEPAGDEGAYNRSQLVLESPPAGVALRARVSADKLKVAQGMTITYQVTVQNVGLTNATGTALADNLPAGTTFVPASLNTQGSPAAAFDGSAVTWSGTVGSGQSTVVTYQVTVTSATGTIANTATIAHASLPVPLQVHVVSQVFGGQDRLYSNETDYAIPDNGCPSWVAAPIVVGDTFAIASVRVGISLDHTYRGDISAKLRSPAGAQVDLIAYDVDDYRENYDILLDSASANPLNDGSADDLGVPFYDRSVGPAQPLSGFAGQNAAGTWTLSVCDTEKVDDGTLRQWSLFFEVSSSTLAGDVDGDCDVDVVDIMLIATRWNAAPGDPRYEQRYDLDRDGDIDIVDVMTVASHWGRTCTLP